MDSVIHKLVLASKLLTAKANHKGAMIALYLPQKIAKSLKVTGGEDTEDMHLTLVYLGDAKDFDKNQKNQIKSITELCSLMFEPIEAKVSGFGVFKNAKGKVLYASIDAPELNPLRQQLTDLLDQVGIEYPQDHGFTPHVTLKYMGEDEEIDIEELESAFKEQKLTFEDLWFVNSGDFTKFKFKT